VCFFPCPCPCPPKGGKRGKKGVALQGKKNPLFPLSLCEKKLRFFSRAPPLSLIEGRSTPFVKGDFFFPLCFAKQRGKGVLCFPCPPKGGKRGIGKGRKEDKKGYAKLKSQSRKFFI
jgi:hypothetical protein